MDISTLSIIILVFLLAGTVKGVIGLGLPTVSLAILTIAMDLTSAMTLLLIPSFVTNVWQALVGGFGLNLLKRLWPFFLTATISVPLGGILLSEIDTSWLSKILGLLIASYALIGILGWGLTIRDENQFWAAPSFGVCNGIFTGMTGSFVVPGVLYLNSTGLPRDALVQAMGILFSLATVALAFTLAEKGFLTLELGLSSLTGLPPAVIGMVIGQKIRQKLSERTFKKSFFGVLLFLGLYIILSI